MLYSRLRIATLAIVAFLVAACGDNARLTPASSEKEIAAFSFESSKNPVLQSAVTATISGTSIAATVPFGTDVTALVATFTATGEIVDVGGVGQLSGVTPNDFRNPVSYVVTAADASTKVYTVTVTVAASSAKDITSYAFLGLTPGVNATINGTTIAATVPYGTNVTGLVATFTMTGETAGVGGVTQISSTTANDFTNPVTYTVTAADGTTKDYTVTVTVALNTAKNITAFELTSALNSGAGVSSDAVATITGTTIGVTVPYGTDVTALIATFSTTGQTVNVGATAQASGVTPNDFTNPVSYVVTAADSTTKTYVVTVTIALNPAKDLTSFGFTSALNGGAGISSDVVATISGTNIFATVPYATDVTALIATFSTTGASVAVGGTTQATGVTPNDFTNPVTYTVTAADSTTKTYTVTITVALNPAKDLTSFAFTSVLNSGAGVSSDAIGQINGLNIAVTVPYATDVTGLIATFATTGQTVDIGGANQASGITANDFTNPVSYTVTAADGTTKTYVVTVTVALNPAKDISSFEFTSALNGGLGISSDVVATITGTDITATVPYGTDTTGLIASFTTTGQDVTVSGVAQASGVTANDFTSAVSYVVTAADSTTQTYTVTITVALNPAKDLTAFSFLTVNNAGLTQNRTGTITGTAIAITLPARTDVTALVATFTTTGQSVAVGATTQVSGMTANDFTNPVDYTVTAADGTTQTYTVTATVIPLLGIGVRTLHLDAGVGAPMTIAYDPVRGLYYGSDGGYPGNAVYLWSSSGGAAIQTSTIDIDMRAFLWNANTSQIEACPYNAVGGQYPYSTPTLDASGHFLGGHTAILSSMPGIPDSQSSPAYDPGRDVLYSRGNDNIVSIAKRSDGSSTGAIALDFTTAGVVDAQYDEIGYDPATDLLLVLDHTSGGDTVRGFETATGAYVGSVQLDVSDPYPWYNGNFSNGQWFEYDGSGWQGWTITGP